VVRHQQRTRMARRQALDSLSLLRNLTPTRRIMGLVAMPNSTIGMSVSDPYLSFAKPLTHSVSFASGHNPLPKLLDVTKEEGADAWLIGLPVLMDVTIKKDQNHMKLRDDLLTLFVKSSLPLPAFCISKIKPSSIDFVTKEHTANIQWDAIDVHLLLKDNNNEEGKAGIHASIALQMWLDEHCGGWANTFG
jgi:RNase H-fold protein (predicted Holliday junction resolvase)